MLDILERVEDKTEIMLKPGENRKRLLETVKKINDGTARLVTLSQ